MLPLSTIHADDRERTPPRLKSGRLQKRARVEPSLREQTRPDGFSLAKVPKHIFLGVLEDVSISDIPNATYVVARGSTLPVDAALIDDLSLESAFIIGLSTGVQASLYTKLKKVQEDTKYSMKKLFGTIQENENLKARLIQAKKGELLWNNSSHCKPKPCIWGLRWKGGSTNAMSRTRRQISLREEVERCRSFESEAVHLREEKDKEIARLKAELEWPSEEEVEEEERLAKMLVEAEADKEEGSEDEGAGDEEVKAVEPDSRDQ
ncbi:hypothetical protein O6P43_030054 [Quillaja saponaria]|uniref:Uncharacterized protein n=1 Tax=Quillaja saponaria TaxID=32244 RepID=A0AAD7PBR9_QUISA|nr:hypothetical protein O6P43_030054 [Quillaja saponaria]